MKRSLLMIILVALCTSLLLIGTGTITLHASRPATIEHDTDVNYNYLSDPQLLSAGADYLYLVNLKDSSPELHLISYTTGLSDYIHPLNGINPTFIKVVGDKLFIFETTKYHIFDTADLLNDTPLSQSISQTHDDTYTFFDVTFSSGEYTIYFANSTHYGNISFTQTPTALEDSQLLTTFPIIAALAESFLCVADIHGEYYIYDPSTNSTLNALYFSTPTSLSYSNSFNTFAVTTVKNQLLFFKKTTESEQTTTASNIISPAFATASHDESGFFCIDTDNTRKSIMKFSLTTDDNITSSTLSAHRGTSDGLYDYPLSICLTDKDTYLVSDLSGQIRKVTKTEASQTSAPFAQSSRGELFPARAMCFDNYNLVYIYDYNTTLNIKRIRSFDLDGNLIATYSHYENNLQFENITKLTADTNRTIYAIDTANRIYTLKPDTQNMPTSMSEFTLFPKDDYKIISATTLQSPSTSIITSETLNALVLTNVMRKADDEIVSLAIPLNNTDTPYEIDAFGANILDITTDTLGNFIVLSKPNPADFRLTLFPHDAISSPTLIVNEQLTGASVYIPNPSLTLDKLGGKLYYIGAHHAIESATVQDLWSFAGKSAPNNWETEISPLEASSLNLLYKAKNDVVIFTYPNGIAPQKLAPKNSMFKVLDSNVTFGSTQNGDEQLFNYLHILYEIPDSGETVTGYIRNHADLIETYNAQNPSFISGRVLYYNTIIFKYPTSLNYNLKVGTVDKNYNDEQKNLHQGLVINRYIDIPDLRGWTYYEVLTDAQGRPDAHGSYVGYIYEKNIIDYNGAPSSVRFTTNANVISSIPIYRNKTDDLHFDILSKNQQIRIYGKLDKTQKYTYVKYIHSDTRAEESGYIETKYISMNGITAMQIVAIIALVTCVLLALAFVYFRIFKSNVKTGR